MSIHTFNNIKPIGQNDVKELSDLHHRIITRSIFQNIKYITHWNILPKKNQIGLHFQLSEFVAYRQTVNVKLPKMVILKLNSDVNAAIAISASDETKHVDGKFHRFSDG